MVFLQSTEDKLKSQMRHLPSAKDLNNFILSFILTTQYLD